MADLYSQSEIASVHPIQACVSGSAIRCALTLEEEEKKANEANSREGPVLQVIRRSFINQQNTRSSKVSQAAALCNVCIPRVL